MDLHKFIETTIGEIQKGVQNAIKNSVGDNNSKGVINPVWGSNNDISVDHVQKIYFDIAVTIAKTGTDAVEGGIRVIGIHIGGKKSSVIENTHVSRIQFSVPIVMPVTTVSRTV